ncbi:multicopper oxidase family protein [Testudinibacter sp. TR-2022]|uniref:multicopper oxidase family protein n=1 Tax=Testudinibacter sp. TR-2022 TaxID=2585029 RepID=UPI002279DE68|nr:multicopper oxidase family protein [Testudinibacter sp. TR-2022]
MNSIKRRDFLRYSIALGLATHYGWVEATPHMHHGEMMSPNMGGIGAMQSADLPLMPPSAMPSGQPLSPLVQLANQSDQSAVFEADLEAKVVEMELAGGKKTEVWAYNGQLPGPQIVVNEGDTVRIRFKNSLPQPTTIHWHGLAVPEAQDGNPQDEVLPGQTRLYEFKIAENSAGTYWYHPHPHGLVAEQVYMGLAGSLIIKSKTDPFAHLQEQHWLISDLRLDQDGRIPPNTLSDWINGREGEFVLINAQLTPQISLNGNQRLRIWNATSARYFRLHLPNVEWIVVGTDGGLLEEPLSAGDELFLVPGQRLEVIPRISQNGTATLISRYYDRRKMMVREAPTTLTLAKVELTQADVALPQRLRTFAALPPIAVKRTVVFRERMPSGMNGNTASMLQNMFLVNDQVFDMKRIDFEGKQGETEEWLLFNSSHMDHPFHIHGTQFELINRTLNGETRQEPYRAKRDILNLKPMEKALIRFVQTEKGLKMFHCHILEHETLGMMAMLQVK